MVLVFSLALRHGFRQMSLPLMSRRTRIWVDKTLPGKQFDFLKVNAFKKCNGNGNTTHVYVATTSWRAFGSSGYVVVLQRWLKHDNVYLVVKMNICQLHLGPMMGWCWPHISTSICNMYSIAIWSLYRRNNIILIVIFVMKSNIKRNTLPTSVNLQFDLTRRNTRSVVNMKDTALGPYSPI